MKVAIQEIVVEDRRREEMGNIDELAQSIADVGLLHPIVIDNRNRLVAGERRLRACQSLGLADIEVKRLGELTQDELRKIELEENLRRKNLEPHERSKFRMAVKERAETCPPSGQVSKPSRGPSRTPGSMRDTAAKAGVARMTIHKATKHTEAVERYPFMQRWPQAHALNAAKALDAMTEEQRADIVPQIETATGTKDIVRFIQRAASPSRLTTSSPLPDTKQSQAKVKHDYTVDLRAAMHHLSRAAETDNASHSERIYAVIREIQEMLDEVGR